MLLTGLTGIFTLSVHPQIEKVGFKSIQYPKVPCELMVCWSCTHTLSLFFSFLSLSFPLLPFCPSTYVVDDRKEMFGGSLVATIGYGGCAIQLKMACSIRMGNQTISADLALPCLYDLYDDKARLARQICIDQPMTVDFLEIVDEH